MPRNGGGVMTTNLVKMMTMTLRYAGTGWEREHFEARLGSVCILVKWVV